MPHWKNPWENAIPVPLEELAEALEGGEIETAMGVVPYDKEFLMTWFRSHGDKLDAYVLQTQGGAGKWISAGVRFGNEGHQYLSPYGDQKRLAALVQKYGTAAPVMEGND